MNNIIVIIPTYNEAENIPIIINKINSLSVKYDILVVDGNSTDDTVLIVQNIMKVYNIIAEIHNLQMLADQPFQSHLQSNCKGSNLKTAEFKIPLFLRKSTHHVAKFSSP